MNFFFFFFLSRDTIDIKFIYSTKSERERERNSLFPSLPINTEKLFILLDFLFLPLFNVILTFSLSLSLSRLFYSTQKRVSTVSIVDKYIQITQNSLKDLLTYIYIYVIEIEISLSLSLLVNGICTFDLCKKNGDYSFTNESLDVLKTQFSITLFTC